MFRDIQQLREAPPFGATAVEGMLSVEALLQESLRFVPYCNEHRGVWSSHFTRIIIDAASQLDSLWKATASKESPGTASERLNITDHWDRFGKLVARQQVVFFSGASPLTIGPFLAWNSSTYSSPTWWDAYNKLKHDRLSNQTEATLEHAVNAVAGLFLGIIYSGVCDPALMSATLLDTSHYHPWAFTETGLLRDINFEGHAKLETKLFAHPIGIFGVDDCNLAPDWRSASARFNMWWALNASTYNKPRPGA